MVYLVYQVASANQKVFKNSLPEPNLILDYDT